MNTPYMHQKKMEENNSRRTRQLKVILTETSKSLTKMLLMIVFVAASAASASAVVYTVNELGDAGDGTCDATCTLRDAITTANGTAADDVINFTVEGTITLTLGELSISAANGKLTIFGPGADQLSVSGNNMSRVFRINFGANAEINDITIRDGSGRFGGIISTLGTLTLNNSTVSNNSVRPEINGGGIYNLGVGGILTLNNSTVSNNYAEFGGGIFNFNGTVTLNNSTVVGNNSDISGGGIYSSAGTLTLTNSTISNNSAPSGGGGIWLEFTTVTINNSTISNNSAGGGGGIYNDRSTLMLNNSIIANSTGGDCTTTTDSASITNATNSLIEDGLGCVNGTNSNNLTGDPNLGPLQNNGGPTFTHALLPGSIAINAGNNSLIPTGITTDQRGASRISDTTVDMGAFELSIFTVTKIEDTDDGSCDAADCSLREAVAAANRVFTDDTINFASPLFDSPQTITLTLGELTIADNGKLTIFGRGADQLSVSGNNALSRVFLINTGANAEINDITIRDGFSDDGGGILNFGILTLNNSTVSNNSIIPGTDGNGGGIYNGGTLTLNNSTVSNNSASFEKGGGIYNREGTLTLNNSTVSNNTSRSRGGGISSSLGTLTLINSTISNNSASPSGGGGGIALETSTVTINNSTISNNSALGAGGIYNDRSTLTLNNSIIAKSTNGDCLNSTDSATITNATNSLIEDGLGCVNGTNSNNLTGDPLLGPLQDNGGPTFTHALQCRSIAIDAGNSILTTDQRGLLRPFDNPAITNIGNGSDIGAFELQQSCPSAMGEVYQTNENTPLSVPAPGVLSNDSDPDVGDTLTAILVSGPANASSFTLNDDGSFDYAPVSTFTGTDSFTYKVSDGELESETVTATINVIAVPRISINDVSMEEGNSGTTNFNFTVSLSESFAQTVTVDYATADDTATVADNDYTAIPLTTLTFAPTETSKTVSVAVKGDGKVELDETFFVNLSSPTNSIILDGQGVGTIQNDDIPTVTINDLSLPEGTFKPRVFVFDVTLSKPSPLPVTINFATADGTATVSGNDYMAENSSMTFEPGDVKGFIIVSVTADSVFEPDETFFVNLSNPVNAVIADGQAVGTILDDDSQSLSISDVRIAEGNTGTVTALFIVTLTPNQMPDQAVPAVVTVNYQTTPGTATPGTDYVASNGSLTFNPGEMTKTIPITINSDVTKESNEVFAVDLTNVVNATVSDSRGVGFIIDDDRAYLADFDNDKKTDYSVYRPDTNDWYILQSSDGTVKVSNFGLAGDIITPGDFDGDCITDLAYFRPTEGKWYVKQSSNGELVITAFGQNGDKPVQGDFDNDGKTDRAIFRPTTGTWWILQSLDGATKAIQFGLATDRPVQSDYDGDGKTDVAVYRDGVWYVLRSSDGIIKGTSWGLPTDRPITGDFNGDGRSDLTVYRNGTWWIIDSLTREVRTVQLGIASDIPAVGDYDNDGTSDFAVFRPSTGLWFVLKSSDNTITGVKWGMSGDIPVPTAYQSQ